MGPFRAWENWQMKIKLSYEPEGPKGPVASCVIDQQLLIDALHFFITDKRRAYDLVKDTSRFKPEDFAIPQLVEVICILEDW
jgi:hypothetical protein